LYFLQDKATERGKETKEKRLSKRTSVVTTTVLTEDTPRRDLRRQVALSFMPEKVRAAVGSREVMPNASDRYKLSPAPSRSFAAIKDNSLVAEAQVVPHEELKEELLTGLTSEYDLKLFKSAWEKAAQINEEVGMGKFVFFARI
jgi:hypothetical protein